MRNTSKMKNYFFGTAGFAKEVDWLANELYNQSGIDFRPDFFVGEDTNPLIGKEINSVPVISEKEFLNNHIEPLVNCIIAVANPVIRRHIYNKIITSEKKVLFPNLIHPSVLFDKRINKVEFGNGNIVCAGVILTTDIIIKDFVHINLDCTIGHDCLISSFVTISPGVHISGNVKIGDNVYIGTGAVFLERLEIKDNSIIGAGAVVVKSIEESGTYVGLPAKKIK